MSEAEITVENLEQINSTIHELQNIDEISVVDFVTLISNYTRDKGDVLQKVLNEDVSLFKDKADGKAARTYNRIKNEQLAFERDYTKNIVTLLSAVKDILETINKEHPEFNMKMYENDRKHYIKNLYARKKMNSNGHKKYEDLNALWNSHKNEFKRLQEENKDLYNTLNELQREIEFKDNKAAKIEQAKMKEIEQLKIERSRLQDQLNQLQSTVDNILSIRNNRKKRSPFGSPDRRYMPKSELRFMEENSSIPKKELIAPSTSRLPPIKPDYWNPLAPTAKVTNDFYPVSGTSVRNIPAKGSPASIEVKDHVKKYKLDTLLDNYLKRKERKESERSLSPSRREEKLI